jgi:hypothetical protein
MNCQMFSTGLSSGHFGGSKKMVMFIGTTSRSHICQPDCPTPRNLILLPDTRFVAKPDFYCGRVDALVALDFVQPRDEFFLKCSMAPSACAWWRGRAESFR